MNTGNGYSIDGTHNWVAYEIGAASDLRIYWSGADNSKCQFTSTIAVNGTDLVGSQYTGWITHTMAVVSATYTRDVVTDAFTTFATTSSDFALDDWY